MSISESAKKFISNISASHLSIYDHIDIGDPDLWIPTTELELILNSKLQGYKLGELPLRTRSKEVKKQVCEVLGYQIPPSFKKTRPRFVGQNFDTYIQKSRNLQIWNEELSPNRRYVLIQVSSDNEITKVKVVPGDMLANFDTTGKLTQKYQASLIPGKEYTELITTEDTDRIKAFVSETLSDNSSISPISNPMQDKILSINAIFNILKQLIAISFSDKGSDQERNRGAELHRLICEKLGYSDFKDDGRFPDIRNQLLEIKLQTSPTIDLGLFSPDSQESLEIPKLKGQQIRHCDVRYALFYGTTDGDTVTLTHFFLTTGGNFFSRFPQFQGKILNKKLQMPLPKDFFD